MGDVVRLGTYKEPPGCEECGCEGFWTRYSGESPVLVCQDCGHIQHTMWWVLMEPEKGA